MAKKQPEDDGVDYLRVTVDLIATPMASWAEVQDMTGWELDAAIRDGKFEVEGVSDWENHGVNEDLGRARNADEALFGGD